MRLYRPEYICLVGLGTRLNSFILRVRYILMIVEGSRKITTDSRQTETAGLLDASLHRRLANGLLLYLGQQGCVGSTQPLEKRRNTPYPITQGSTGPPSTTSACFKSVDSITTLYQERFTRANQSCDNSVYHRSRMPGFAPTLS